GAAWLAAPGSDRWARSYLKLDSIASSPTDISQPRPFPSFQPGARCVRVADTASVAVGVLIVASATPNGYSAEQSLRELKMRTPVNPSSYSPPFRQPTLLCTTTGTTSLA